MRYVAVIVFVVAILAAIAVTKHVRAPANTVTIANGMRIEYLGSALGGTTFRTEKKWEKAARRFLPAGLQSLIPPSINGSCSSGTNSVTFYFKVTDPSGARITGTPWMYYGSQDDEGFEYPRNGGFCSFGGSSNTMFYGLIMQAFPRRQKDFEFDFLGPAGTSLATFRVPNPVTNAFPQWQPLPLPQVRTNGPVVLALEELELKGRKLSQHITPKWNLTHTDPRWAHARARSVSLLDATGNEAQMLSPRENAWKVRTFVHRGWPEDFGPADRLSVTNIPLPKAGEFIAVDRATQIDGFTLKLHVVAGPGTLTVSNGTQRSMSSVPSGHSTSQSGTNTVETWGSARHFLICDVIGAADEDEIHVLITDDAGRSLTSNDSGYYARQSTRQYQRAFTPNSESKSLSIDITVSHPLMFEFLVNPKEVRPK